MNDESCPCCGADWLLDRNGARYWVCGSRRKQPGRIVTQTTECLQGQVQRVSTLLGEARMEVARLNKSPGYSLALDLVAHLYRQRAFSARTFGPDFRVRGIVNHIRKELSEIEAEPHDLKEWIDVVILAFDGAWRQGYSPEEIAAALATKQAENEARTWPDWRTVPDDKPIEHVRGKDW